MPNNTYDIAIIGAGIIGLATAKALIDQSVRSLIVVEAEERIAAHQTGHNSGVIHAGLYYKPGSLKAKNCAVGREMMYRFCAEHDIPHQRCGKLVVAVQESEIPALEELHRRGTANGLHEMRRLDADELRKYEPHVRGVAGLLVPETGIVDYKAVAKVLAEIVKNGNGEICLGEPVRGVTRDANGLLLKTSTREVRCRNLINCGGLYADRVARMCGLSPGLRIIPFRGEYYELTEERSHLVKNLIYPVPDPRFPFLGVHFTRTIAGPIEAGPNAVLAFCRAGYRRRDVSLRDVWDMATYSGFWRMAFKYAGMGMAEMYRSFSKRSFWRALQRLVPDVGYDDIRPAGSGVRAQALEPNGRLVDDFRILEAERMIHVLNAPSPAATAALSIGQTIAAKARDSFT